MSGPSARALVRGHRAVGAVADPGFDHVAEAPLAEAVHRPVEAAAVACKSEVHGYLPNMVLARAYQFRQEEPRSDLRDLDRVALTAAVVSDDGDALPPGSEGTIVSVYRDGEAYVVEFPTPLGALATVRPGDLRLIERAPM